jgi:hypothetical protein
MILTDDQVKTIADKGRELPDAILAPLVIAAVLSMLDPQTPARAIDVPATPTKPDAPAKPPTARVFRKTVQAVQDVVGYVTANPGARMAAITNHIGRERSWTRKLVDRAMKDGLIERRGDSRLPAYFPASAAPAEPQQPSVLLTEQRIDGENKQRLVRVERRQGVGKRTAPATPSQRRFALVEFLRARPGAQRGDIVKHLACNLGQAQYAMIQSMRAGEIRMEGERAAARYYVRGYVNGATPQQPATVSA